MGLTNLPVFSLPIIDHQFFPDTCKCHGTDVLHIESHHDFTDGALLQYPIIKGIYTFNDPPASGLHPQGFFTKPGMAFFCILGYVYVIL